MKYGAIAGILLIASLAERATAKDMMQVVTITDIGQPYTVINGDCKFAVLHDDPTAIFSGTGYVETAWESTTNQAVSNLVDDAKKLGGDAIVGARISTIGGSGQSGGSVSVGLDGVLACGTIVKFKK